LTWCKPGRGGLRRAACPARIDFGLNAAAAHRPDPAGQERFAGIPRVRVRCRDAYRSAM
jgi:hypothetical protein